MIPFYRRLYLFDYTMSIILSKNTPLLLPSDSSTVLLLNLYINANAKREYNLVNILHYYNIINLYSKRLH